MSRTKRGCVWVVVLAAVVALAPIATIRWDGGFPSAEYQLTFIDQSGRPVPGVTLRVETKAGSVCHLYPVNEFLPGQAPSSDVEGRMTFHHVGTLEFGGSDTGCLLGITYRRSRSPEYVCVFSHAGREVYRIRYDELRRRGADNLPQVERVWKHSDWPMRELLAARGQGANLHLRLFDGNQDGVLDREESVAAHYFDTVMERQDPKTITFCVVERTITISVP